MLRLNKISKNYSVADQQVDALKEISISFRKNEFVSILGPSGCGKTTTLNIIGGLDKYSSGDLYINGISTKKFKDKDWDVYRNHRIGFIFQSYNLIPHQTVLGNVELALTISGATKEEREKKAKKALDRVGLKGQYNKKPNQLSGGQCQRVAIARALVNEPEILLADEPTGALDTATSIQIMELIKEISNDKVVIMVTHNPELAEKYSSRIVKLLDGEIVSDSNPFSEGDEIIEVKKNQEPTDNNKVEKAKMSFPTAFKLSAKNLWTKGKRTALTCIAGSIGIIGISMVLAVSSGVKGYIGDMQNDMLSGNPITIKETSLDINQMMSSLTASQKADIIKKANTVNVNSVIDQLIAQDQMLVKNTITDKYIEYLKGLSKEDVACLHLDYSINLLNNIYTDYSVSNTIKDNVSLSTIKEIYTTVLQETEFKQYASYVTSISNLIAEAPNNNDYLLSQYDIISGNIATKENEIMVVLDENSSLTDLVLAQLGYYTQDEFIYTSDKSADKTNSLYKNKFSFDEILNKEFTYYSNDQVFNDNRSNPVTGSFYPFTYNSNSEAITTEGMKLKVVGILQPKDEVNYGSLTSGFYYTEKLSKKFRDEAPSSLLYKYFDENNIDTLSTALFNGQFIPSTDSSTKNIGIPYTYSYTFNGETKEKTSYVGSYVDYSFMSSYMASMGGAADTSQPSGISIANYTLSLREIGGATLPNSISIYPVNFERKDNITSYLDAWNNDELLSINGVDVPKADRPKITYTDSIALIITMINSMIDMITVALVAFTALSLIVSCVMIAIITYVSVMERIKEIGVIRSLGGRKKDVSHLFNAETFIIGAISGIFGIGVTYLVSIILNLIVSQAVGIKSICALPWYEALIMILLSIVLTVISGLIPSRSAAKKDPVTALRTE